MARMIIADPPEFTRQPVNRSRLSYDIELITPMVGGGSKSWIPDIDNPVRTQAVKGQLRFWWRTMQPAVSADELKSSEDALWGRTDLASPVRLSVEINDKPDPMTIPWNGNYLDFSGSGLPGYVLFPLQNVFNPGDQCTLIRSLSFTLHVECDPAREEVIRNTITLWLLFGGLGARTTRGCGSLYCREVMDSFPDGRTIKEFLDSLCPEEIPGPGSAPWPMLGNCRLGFQEETAHQDTIQTWSSYLERYKNFRQGANYARERGTGNRPGRSRWPEPDAIRRISTSQNHRPRHGSDWYPRAAYGMPIEFKFNTHPQNGDPTDPQGKFYIQPENAPRWPSPIILKVIRLSNGSPAKIWLHLNSAIPDNLVLQANDYGNFPVSPSQHPSDSAGKQLLYGYANPPAGTDPYQALTDYLNIQEVP